MTKDDILELAREARLGNVLCHNSVEGDRVWIEGADWHDELERFAELLEAKVRADERETLLAAIKKLRDESQTIVGASDDYKQGREMGIQLCINELTRGEE